ncbi:MAG: hypothetical protein AAGJ37_02025 [Pseudomonadota bacterium]
MRDALKQKLQQLESLGNNRALMSGYGSLLSAYSRHVHSQISAPGLSITIHNWSRSWITRAYHESQTYVGAVKDAGESFNALLLAAEVAPEFLQREQDYRFTQIADADIELEEFIVSTVEENGSINACSSGLEADEIELIRAYMQTHPVYVCESLSVVPADEGHPVNYSYIATCLSGCFEICGEKGVERFMRSTKGWAGEHFYDDLGDHKYPRAAVNALCDFEVGKLIKQYG